MLRSILKIPKIEVHISNIYKREEFRQKSLLSGVVTGGIFGLGPECYILAIRALQIFNEKMEIDKKIILKVNYKL